MDAPPVQYVKTSDGYDIAFSVAGSGRTVILPPLLHNHVQLNWRDDLTILRRAAFLNKLTETFRVVLYDNRGQGMSSRGLPEDLSLEDLSLDTEAVVERVAPEPFVFVACARAGHLAVRYAVKHPERVAALVLICCPVSMQAWPSGLFELLPSQKWEVFLQAFLLPGLPLQDVRRGIEMLKETATPKDHDLGWRAWKTSDLSDLLPQISTPTLVIHARDFPLLAPEESMKLAAGIPGAQLVVIEGNEIHGDADRTTQTISNFLQSSVNQEAEASLAAESGAQHNGALSRRQLEVLRLIGLGQSNKEIAERLVLSVRTVERHAGEIYPRIGVANRAQAAVYARDHGLA